MSAPAKQKFTDLKLPEWKKFELPKGTWKPFSSRIKLEVIQDSLSSIIDTSGTVRDPYVVARVLDWGPLCGYDRIIENGTVVSLQVHKFEIGDIVLTTRSNLQFYKDPEGKDHVFLHDESKIIARLEQEEK
jgi:hypothetical protein